jgi:hypothetical protein
MQRLMLLRGPTCCVRTGDLIQTSEALARKQTVSGHGFLSKYFHTAPIYLTQGRVTYISLHLVYIAAVFDFLYVWISSSLLNIF